MNFQQYPQEQWQVLAQAHHHLNCTRLWTLQSKALGRGGARESRVEEGGEGLTGDHHRGGHGLAVLDNKLEMEPVGEVAR